jgi:hypothetical protein
VGGSPPFPPYVSFSFFSSFRFLVLVFKHTLACIILLKLLVEERPSNFHVALFENKLNLKAMEGMKLGILLVFCALVAMFPTLRAHIADFDEVWQQRAEEARKDALKAYHRNPEDVTDHFNERVHE